MSKIPVVLVTGASRGLGRGIALRCANAGYSVAIHYSGNIAAANETMKLCQQAATAKLQKFAIVQGNLGVNRDREILFAQTLSSMGRLDGLVNNAGIAPTVRADITEMSEESYDEVMGINLKGPFFLSQMAARHWLKHPGKSRFAAGYKLIFVTSISADTASVNRAEYCLSKAGLSMAVQLWATRLAAEGTQVFEIRPGIMATDMTAGVKEKYDKMIEDGLVPQRRWGKPDDVGLAVEVILRGAFPFSTGQTISVDGGFHMRRL